eukprot:128287-Chlamydomonas_euryale.AAC.1
MMMMQAIIESVTAPEANSVGEGQQAAGKVRTTGAVATGAHVCIARVVTVEYRRGGSLSPN